MSYIKNYETIMEKIKKECIKSIISVNNNLLSDNAISIVMTTNKRIEQTFFTLNTISRSNFKDIEIIIVDDSQKEYLIDLKQLESTKLNIKYIIVENKFWVNPCINYNIGLSHTKCNKIILQNAEVCHIGDVISYVSKNLNETNYLVFDVAGVVKQEDNSTVYATDGIYDTMAKQLYKKQNNHHRLFSWLQHYSYINTGYHYLVAIHKKNIIKLNGGFDMDFMNGSCYDDSELIYRVRYVLNLKIINVINETTKLMGVHLFHQRNLKSGIYSCNGSNAFLLYKKCTYFNINNRWYYITENKYTYGYLFSYYNMDGLYPVKISELNSTICNITFEKTKNNISFSSFGISHVLFEKYIGKYITVSFIIYTNSLSTVGKYIICHASRKNQQGLNTGYKISMEKQYVSVNLTYCSNIPYFTISNLSEGDNIIFENFFVSEYKPVSIIQMKT